MLRRRLVTIACGLSLATTVHATSTSIPRGNQPLVGSATAVEKLAEAYRHRSPDEIGAVLAGDYMFHSSGDSLHRFLAGSARATEMNAVRGMLLGVKHGDQVIMPPAEHVDMVVDGVSQQLDPEHPDSTEQFRVLTVKRFEIHIQIKGRHSMDTPASMHVFHVVRGDAAVLAEGQTADPNRWYIRRWLNDVSGVRAALDRHKGDCGEDPPADPPAAATAITTDPPSPGALGIRPLTNPACALLRVSCDLPGSEPAHVEVYDVTGRRVNTRQIAVTAPGNVSVDAGAGAHLLPGVYWVRLGQAARKPGTRMVVVAR